jgi:hypothetical protein
MKYEVLKKVITEECVRVATFDNREQAMAAGVAIDDHAAVVRVDASDEWETIWDSRQGWAATEPEYET